MLQTSTNVIGEPTTVLFNKLFLTEKFGTLNNRTYNCSVDMAPWVHLLSKGKAVYIAEPLSSFRYHSGQQLHQKLLEETEDFTHLILTSRKYGFYKNMKITSLEYIVPYIGLPGHFNTTRLIQT